MMVYRSALRPLTAVIVFVVVLGSACTSSQDQDPDLVDFLLVALRWNAPSESERHAYLTTTRTILDQQEEAIEACMAERGYDYDPVPSDERFGILSDSERPWGSDEWIEHYGFGITTTEFGQSRLPRHLVGIPDSSALNVRTLKDDPNAQRLQSMSQEERRKYLEALEGSREGSGTHPGCRHEAQRRFPIPIVIFERALGPQLAQLEDNIHALPTLVQATRDAVQCVANEFGLEFPGYESLATYFEQEMVELGLRAAPGSGATPLQSGSTAWEEALDRVQTHEVELAIAVSSCGLGPSEWGALKAEAARPRRIEFLRAHWKDIVRIVGQHPPEDSA